MTPGEFLRLLGFLGLLVLGFRGAGRLLRFRFETSGARERGEARSPGRREPARRPDSGLPAVGRNPIRLLPYLLQAWFKPALRQARLSPVLVARVALAEAAEAYPRGHADRVAATARLLALALGGSEALALMAWQAGYLHDVGEAELGEVLRRPGLLKPAERRLVQAHPLQGEALIRLERRLDREVTLAVRHHHERFDGSGYPDGLLGEGIPLLARVVALSDVWEALRHRRPYRAAFTPHEAVRELAQLAGQAYDAHLVEVFLAEVVPLLPG